MAPQLWHSTECIFTRFEEPLNTTICVSENRGKMYNINRNLFKLGIAVVVLALLVNSTSMSVSAVASPQLVILSPGGVLNKSTVVTPSFVVAFLVSNFQFVAPGMPGQTNQPGMGHMHVFLDGVYWNLWSQAEGIPFNNVPAGQHNITLQLVNSDHTPLSPDVEASVIVQVTTAPQGSPKLAILSPAGLLNNATTVSPSFVVSFAVFNFVLTEPVGQPKALNTGHIHIFLDGAYYGQATSVNSIQFIGLSPGAHTIKLELVNNDHSSLSPGVSQSITVTVSGASTAMSTSNSLSIPGFPVEAVFAGALIWIGALAYLAHRRKANQ